MGKRLAVVDSDQGHWRPRTRKDCELVERPCPYVGCKYNLALDVHENGTTISLAQGRSHGRHSHRVVVDRRDFSHWSDAVSTVLEDLPDSCALDVADRGGAMLKDIGAIMGIVVERVRQIESEALSELRARDGDEILLGLLQSVSRHGEHVSALADAQRLPAPRHGDAAAIRSGISDFENRESVKT